VWSMDHKILSRPTKQGIQRYCVIIDSFSGWPILRAVPDVFAYTTAKIFITDVICTFGICDSIVTDRGVSFCANFFKHITEFLKIHHRISTTAASRTNGLSESLIQRMNQMLKCYCERDVDIEDTLPIIVFFACDSFYSRLPISPHEILFGRQMKVSEFGLVPPKLPFAGDQLAYYRW